MARVVAGRARGAIDPLKLSAPLGGALVFLGLARAIPVLHGSQGCASFAKALLTRHFREPIPLQTTAVTEVSAVIGAGDLLAAAIDTVRARFHPEIVGLLTTGLTEVNGEDVAAELKSYVDGIEGGGPLVVGVSTPDFTGGLSDGYAAALEALIRAVPLDPPLGAPDAARGYGEPGPIAILVGPELSSVDIDEVADLATACGLDPIVVPDISGSLDGHLDDGWSPLTTGGTSRDNLRRLGQCTRIAAIGGTAAAAAEALSERTDAPVAHFGHLCGLAASDEFVAYLLDESSWSARVGRGAGRLGGAPAPAWARRWRARLADGMLDAHFTLGGARVALALEPDQMYGVATLLREVGAEVVTAVAPQAAPVLAEVPCDEVVIGDLADLEEHATEAGAELVLAGSHARSIAERIGAAYLAIGFPVYDRLGAGLRGTAGYAGSLRLLADAANVLLDRTSEDHPAHRPSPATQRGAGRRDPLEESIC
jgi:nitrogenase molybdenum-iron protein NifN